MRSNTDIKKKIEEVENVISSEKDTRVEDYWKCYKSTLIKELDLRASKDAEEWLSNGSMSFPSTPFA